MSQSQRNTGARRMALLCEGQFGHGSSKTSTGLLLWCPDEVVAVIDSKAAGRNCEDIVGFGKGVPIVASVAEAVAVGANQIVVGVASAGGCLFDGYKERLLEAIGLGCDVVSGLHVMLNDDPELSAAAKKAGVTIHDVRKVPQVPVCSNKARGLPNKRILTVGTDCESGKKCTAIFLTRGLRELGLDAAYVATGQTGIMISGRGAAIDRSICDFASGVAQQLVLGAADHEWIIIEGQGSLDHPAYSGVSLSLLHGSAPQALIVCHVHGRVERTQHNSQVASIAETIRLNEIISTPILPTKVVAISVVTRAIADDGEALAELKRLEDEFGIPATDPLRFGTKKLTDALIAFFADK